MNQQLRSRVLADYGATIAEIDELLHYNRNIFDQTRTSFSLFYS